MCHHHRTVHRPCHHLHDTITLCHASLLPLVKRATASPSPLLPTVAEQHPISADLEHDITRTATESVEPCRRCQLPDLDVWHMDGAVNLVGDIAKLERRKEHGIQVEIGNGGQGPPAPAPAPTTAPLDMTVPERGHASVRLEPGLEQQELRAAEKRETDEMLEEVEMPATSVAMKDGALEQPGRNGCVMALPYVGGLGLLVMASKSWRRPPKARL